MVLHQKSFYQKMKGGTNFRSRKQGEGSQLRGQFEERGVFRGTRRGQGVRLVGNALFLKSHQDREESGELKKERGARKGGSKKKGEGSKERG